MQSEAVKRRTIITMQANDQENPAAFIPAGGEKATFENQ